MKLRKGKKRTDKGAPKWMVTYSDMVTLILVFFILLFSMSQIDSVKFEALAESFKNQMIFDFYPSPVPMENPTEKTETQENGDMSSEFETPAEVKNKSDQVQTAAVEKDKLDQLLQEVEAFLDKNNLNNVISANRTDRGVVLVLQEKVLFESAEAEIIDSGKPFLNKVGTLLDNIPNPVLVEGHTDNRAISNFRFPSNWELSGARASGVIRYLIENKDLAPQRFSAVGYGDTRPLVENNSPENWKKNRRVEMVILEPKMNDK